MASAALTVVSDTTENKFTPAAYGFEEFWLLYPRKEARKDAAKAWQQCVIDSALVDIFSSLVDWRRVWAGRTDSRYTPLAASWLRGERWSDEIPTEYRQRPASHAPVKERESGEKTEMPDSVRLAIAKLRKG